MATDVQSILFIRAATSYRTLANSSFVLGRYGRTLRFARVGTLCCRMWFFPTVFNLFDPFLLYAFVFSAYKIEINLFSL